MEIPLKAPVGNAIFDYLTGERPPTTCKALFLCKNKPYRRLRGVWHVSADILAEAGIRKSKGDRKGFHIFRHYGECLQMVGDIDKVGKQATQTIDTHHFIIRARANRDSPSNFCPPTNQANR